MIPSILQWSLLFTIHISPVVSYVCPMHDPYSYRIRHLSSRTPPFVVANIRQPQRYTSTIINLSSSSSSSSSSSLIPNKPDANNKPSNHHKTLLQNAAANLTLTTSPLLGIKSLGIDYGLARTGIATTVGYDPTPLTILPSSNTTLLYQQIVRLVENERVERIVLGLPFHKNGTESEQTELTRRFADGLVCEIGKRLGIGRTPIFLCDERYTSKEAAARARSLDPNVDLYKDLDARAACVILEHYYLDGGEGSEEVFLPEEGGVRDEVERVWAEERGRKDQERKVYQQERDDRLNAREMAMERSRILEQKLLNGTLGITGANKGKKKKKKRKKRGADHKRIIL